MRIIFLRLLSQGHSTVAAAWSDSGLSWAEFLPAATEVNKWVVEMHVNV